MPSFEGEAVDDGLQRRAGRADRLDHVDGAEAACRRDSRPSRRRRAPRRWCDRRRGWRPTASGRARASARRASFSSAAWMSRSSVSRWMCVSGCAATSASDEMRRELGELAARRRDALALGALGLGRRDDAGFERRDRARGCGRVSACLASRSGRRISGDCGKRDEQGRLADREVARLLAEIGERGGAHAFDVAAERREAEVEAQDLVLATARSSSCSARSDLAQLAGAVRSCRPSSRRATCMVSVEPPETMRPMRDEALTPARAKAQRDRRRGCSWKRWSSKAIRIAR